MSQADSPFKASFRRHRWLPGVVHALLVLICLTLIFPVLWMLSTSLKTIEEAMATDVHWIPRSMQWQNYVETVDYIPFWTYTQNTVFACTLAAVGTTLSSALVAYSFSRMEWPGKEILFGITLATMMVPFPVLMVPLYAVFRGLDWIGTLNPIWVPSFFGSAFNIFLLRQFFSRIPKHLPDAMLLDGASEARIFTQLYLPLSKAPLAVVAFFQFIYTWNDFLAPLLFLTEQSTFTLSLGLQFYQSQMVGTQWHYLMAASFLTTVPLAVLFFFVQRSFLRGLGVLKHVEG